MNHHLNKIGPLILGLTVLVIALSVSPANYFAFDQVKELVFIIGSLGFISFYICTTIFSKEAVVRLNYTLLAALCFWFYHLVLYLICENTVSSEFFILSLLLLMTITISHKPSSVSLFPLFQCVASVGVIVVAYCQFSGIKLLPILSVTFSGRISTFQARLSSTFGNPNLLGGFILFALAFTIGLLIKFYLEKKRLLLIFTSTLFIGLCLTLLSCQNRGNIIVICVLVFIVSFHLFCNKIVASVLKCWKQICVGVIFSSALVIFVIGGPYGAPIRKKLNSGRVKEVRISFITNTAKMICQSPQYFVFGSGIGTQAVRYPLYRNTQEMTQAYGVPWLHHRDYHPHNEYIKIFAETGLIGFSLFVIVICSTLTLLLTSGNRIKNAYAYAFITLLVDMLFMRNMGYISIGVLFWIVVGVAGQDERFNLKKIILTLPSKRKRSARLIVTTLLALICAYTVRKSYDYFFRYDQDFGTAMVLRRKGELTESIKALKVSLAKNPQSRVSLYYAAEELHTRRHFKESLNYCDLLIKEDPNFLDIHFIRGANLQALGDIDIAMDEYKKQTLRNNMYWPAYYRLARNNMSKRRFKRAIPDLEDIILIQGLIKRGRKIPVGLVFSAHKMLIEALYSMKEYKYAYEIAEKSLAFIPNDREKQAMEVTLKKLASRFTIKRKY